jgi:predicted nucleic acid-binding protein
LRSAADELSRHTRALSTSIIPDSIVPDRASAGVRSQQLLACNSSLHKGIDQTVALLEQAETVLLRSWCWASFGLALLTGVARPEHEQTLRRFLLKGAVHMLFADDQTTHHYASVFRQLRNQGTPIPTNDIWLAALGLQHNLVLHARDRHIDHLPQIVGV